MFDGRSHIGNCYSKTGTGVVQKDAGTVGPSRTGTSKTRPPVQLAAVSVSLVPIFPFI